MLFRWHHAWYIDTFQGYRIIWGRGWGVLSKDTGHYIDCISVYCILVMWHNCTPGLCTVWNEVMLGLCKGIFCTVASPLTGSASDNPKLISES